MKPEEVIKRLRKAGWSFEEGANHTKAVSPDGKTKVPVPRHKGDLKTGTLKAIEKQTGINLTGRG